MARPKYEGPKKVLVCKSHLLLHPLWTSDQGQDGWYARYSEGQDGWYQYRVQPGDIAVEVTIPHFESEEARVIKELLHHRHIAKIELDKDMRILASKTTQEWWDTRKEERIAALTAALTAALEELGVKIMLVARADGKCAKCGNQIGATTYCGFCGEHLLPLPPKPKEVE